ncbi:MULTISPECIES: DUF512 domain-containing protein [unclassified Clostridium]|uniref:DUF512 domain-containing protein n=1 Tax=unclassified Clostridium TaxID=2614128 RepID=UPI0011073CF0|nr:MULTISPECIES: DUF512 domain-containing protein [unclassified Clostridium]
MNHTIIRVLPGSIAEEVGLERGDALVSINGQPIVDRIDYEYFIAEDALVLQILTKDGQQVEVEIEKDPEEHMGLVFENELMDHMHKCANHCLFCFVDQLPEAARDSLHFKDDDWRLSFLMGNYITLTNVTEREFERILARRPSPMFISVHATDPAVRCHMLGHRQGGKLMDRLHRMAQAGIYFHTQVVFCPGINDAAVLDRTIDELSALYPHCASLAVVPVGLTGHREGLTPLQPVGAMEAEALILQVAAWQEKLLSKLGTRFVFAADEFYTKADHPLPPGEAYEGYPQIENGVGLVRQFQVEFREALAAYPEGIRQICACSVVTGCSAAPYIAELCDIINSKAAAVRVFPVVNRFFGPSVTVAGLVTGQDILHTLKGAQLGEKVLLPRCMLRSGESVFLDDTPLADLQAALQVPVEVVDVDGAAFFSALQRKTVL